MTRRDTSTPTVEAAVGHEWKHHPEPIDRDVPSAGDLVPADGRGDLHGPIGEAFWRSVAAVRALRRAELTPDDRRCGDETCKDDHA